MSFTTPAEGVPYTSTDPDDYTAHLQGLTSGFTSWLPDILTLQAPGGYTLTQPSHATPAAVSGLWGGASQGWYRDLGDEIEWSFRNIYGTQVDADWDPGSGYLGITLPEAPHQAAITAGAGWLFGISGDFGTIRKSSGEFFIDPPISDDPVAIFSPDGITSWATVDPEAAAPPGYALMPDYPVPSTGAVFVVGGSGKYRKA